MFGRESSSSVAIHDLFSVIPMDFQLHKLTSYKYILNFDILVNEIFNIVTVDKTFNTIILNPVSLFLDISFNSFLKTFNNLLISKYRIGGGGIGIVLNL